MVETGLHIAIPKRHYGRIAPRSGLAAKKGIDIGAGVLDPDYRGQVGILLHNSSPETFEFKAGDRVAQLLIERVSNPKVREVEELDETSRGKNGFGSTGVVALEKKVEEEPKDTEQKQ